MSYYNALMNAASVRRETATRHISKTVKALARSAFDSVDVSELFECDESEAHDLHETNMRYANARHDFD